MLAGSGDVEGVVTDVETDCLEDDLLPNENQEIERERTVNEDDTDVSEATVDSVSERLSDFSSKPDMRDADSARVEFNLSETRESHGLVLRSVSRSSTWESDRFCLGRSATSSTGKSGPCMLLSTSENATLVVLRAASSRNARFGEPCTLHGFAGERCAVGTGGMTAYSKRGPSSRDFGGERDVDGDVREVTAGRSPYDSSARSPRRLPTLSALLWAVFRLFIASLSRRSMLCSRRADVRARKTTHRCISSAFRLRQICF